LLYLNTIYIIISFFLTPNIFIILLVLVLLFVFMWYFRNVKTKKSITINEYKKVTKENMDQSNTTDSQNVDTNETEFLNEIDRINFELTQAKLKVVHKNETLSKLKEEVSQLLNESNNDSSKKQLKSMVRLLERELIEDDSWENFALNFDKAHNDFLTRIKTEYPNLSPKDLKICVYLRMNMTTKEIAPLLNISIRGVEIGRYRIRKKIGIDSQVNLNDFMMRF